MQIKKMRIDETDEQERDRLRAERDNIARKFGHQTSGFTRNASPDCQGHTVTITKAVARG